MGYLITYEFGKWDRNINRYYAEDKVIDRNNCALYRQKNTRAEPIIYTTTAYK